MQTRMVEATERERLLALLRVAEAKVHEYIKAVRRQSDEAITYRGKLSLT